MEATQNTQGWHYPVQFRARVVVDQPSLGEDFWERVDLSERAYGVARFATEAGAVAALLGAGIKVTESEPGCPKFGRWDYSQATLLVEDTPRARAFIEKHSYTDLDVVMRDTLRAVANEGGAVREMLLDIEGRRVAGDAGSRPHIILPGIPSPAMVSEGLKSELRALAIATDLVVAGNVQRRRGRIRMLQNKLVRAGYGPASACSN